MKAIATRLLCALLLAGCGGGWTDSDAKSAGDAVRLEQLADHVCQWDGGCNAAAFRALSRAALCANESMLARHGVSFRDSGVECEP
jgi:hypothetical protein